MKIKLRLQPRGEWTEITEQPGITVEEIYRKFESRLPYIILAAKVDGVVESLTWKLEKDSEVELLDMRTQAANLIYQNSLTLLYLNAVEDVLGEVEVDIDTALHKGLFTEVKRKKPVTPEEVKQIEARMHQLVEEDLPLKREKVSIEEAEGIFRRSGQPERIELLQAARGSQRQKQVPF